MKTLIQRSMKPPEKIRIGSRVAIITFPVRRDGRVKGEVTYHTDHSFIPEVREIREVVDTIDKGTTWLKEN